MGASEAFGLILVGAAELVGTSSALGPAIAASLEAWTPAIPVSPALARRALGAPASEP
jgi:hypothetical protein